MAWQNNTPASKLIFDKYDTDRSGVIDKHELLAMCKEMGRALTPFEHENAMFVLDSNRDGTVSYDDFLAWWAHGPTPYNSLLTTTHHILLLHQVGARPLDGRGG